MDLPKPTSRMLLTAAAALILAGCMPSTGDRLASRVCDGSLPSIPGKRVDLGRMSVIAPDRFKLQPGHRLREHWGVTLGGKNQDIGISGGMWGAGSFRGADDPYLEASCEFTVDGTKVAVYAPPNEDSGVPEGEIYLGAIVEIGTPDAWGNTLIGSSIDSSDASELAAFNTVLHSIKRADANRSTPGLR